MRRLLRLLTVISVAFGATQLPAQSSFSPQDTLAYTTASVRLREKPAPNGEEAVARSDLHVRATEAQFVKQLRDFVLLLSSTTSFYELRGETYDEAKTRVMFLKDVIENKGGTDGMALPVRRCACPSAASLWKAAELALTDSAPHFPCGSVSPRLSEGCGGR